jgi:hypothetical protein
LQIFFSFRSSNPGSGSGIRIRNYKKCWIRIRIRIRIKSMRIRNPVLNIIVFKLQRAMVSMRTTSEIQGCGCGSGKNLSCQTRIRNTDPDPGIKIDLFLLKTVVWENILSVRLSCCPATFPLACTQYEGHHHPYQPSDPAPRLGFDSGMIRLTCEDGPFIHEECRYTGIWWTVTPNIL